MNKNCNRNRRAKYQGGTPLGPTAGQRGGVHKRLEQMRQTKENGRLSQDGQPKENHHKYYLKHTIWGCLRQARRMNCEAD